MAVPSTKATLKSYCLRALGYGVIDINVSDDQTDDRLDEALQYFAQYHYDGIERMYLKHLITTAEVARARSDTSTTGTDTVDTDITATWKEGKNFIPIPSSVVSVVQVFPFTDTGAGSNMFDIRYQLRLNDLFDFSSTSVIQYQMTMDNIDLLDPDVQDDLSSISSDLAKPVVGGVAFRGEDDDGLKDLSVTHECLGTGGIAFKKIVLIHK